MANISAEDPETSSVVSCVSHRLLQTFMDVAKTHKVDLPAQITDRMCGNCSILLLPSITYTARLRTRSRHSKVNRGSKDKLKNQLVSYHG